MSTPVTPETGSAPQSRSPGTSRNERTAPAAGDLISAAPIAAFSPEEAADFLAAAPLPVPPICGVEIYKIAYRTTDESGALVPASGALVVPQGLGHPAPLLSYQHGTTTLRWDVASSPPPEGKGYRHLEAVLFGAAGYLTVLPDYLGYGDSGHRFHPYLHAKTLASSVVDLLRSAEAFCTVRRISVSGKLFLAGYSEGGYATMAATKEIQENHPDLSITASAPMAGPYALSQTLTEILGSDSYPGAGYLAFAFWAYDKVYSLDLLERAFTPSCAAALDTLFDGSHRLVEDGVPALPEEIAALFREEFVAEFLGDGWESLKGRIRENDLHSWAPAVPMRLIHSRSDDIVSFENSLSAFQNLNGNKEERLVQLVAAPDGNHGECALPSLLEAIAWFDSLK